MTLPGTDWPGIRQRVEALRAHADHGKVFGAAVFGVGHGFVLEAGLSSDELLALESWLGVSLPDDYRSFLTDVGAGVAGPGYGVLPVRRQTVSGWAWHGDGATMTDPSRIADPFPVARTLNSRIDSLGPRPEKHDFAGEEEWHQAYGVWQAEVDEMLNDPDLTAGAICLCHHGCGMYDWLIVSGPARGTMWSDLRCDDVDLAPILHDDKPVTFRDWYIDWLTDAEVKLGIHPDR
ncbi:MAG: SMI1/KNR4 family protein [Hamadaea sp.]|uniref:SMI1/KNR4 family protein n=1 Tax=Hamadaea sp. TaxID=2024425 RepID=UPI0017E33EEF|nr:SMI1/KNR4 family protein [Hamadaea sp.]NUT20443.1 SMI1/KNR4 family protein [Hamadaea sp.]